MLWNNSSVDTVLQCVRSADVQNQSYWYEPAADVPRFVPDLFEAIFHSYVLVLLLFGVMCSMFVLLLCVFFITEKYRIPFGYQAATNAFFCICMTLRYANRMFFFVFDSADSCKLFDFVLNVGCVCLVFGQMAPSLQRYSIFCMPVCSLTVQRASVLLPLCACLFSLSVVLPTLSFFVLPPQLCLERLCGRYAIFDIGTIQLLLCALVWLLTCVMCLKARLTLLHMVNSADMKVFAGKDQRIVRGLYAQVVKPSLLFMPQAICQVVSQTAGFANPFLKLYVYLVKDSLLVVRVALWQAFLPVLFAAPFGTYSLLVRTAIYPQLRDDRVEMVLLSFLYVTPLVNFLAVITFLQPFQVAAARILPI